MNDDELLQQLRAAVEELDPVPEAVVKVARRAHQWDHALELLTLTYDSGADLAASGMRSSTTVRDLTFSAGEFELELTIDGDWINGRVSPEASRVQLLVPGQEPVSVAVDAAGRFRVTNSGGAVAFAVGGSDGLDHRTELVHFEP